MTVYVGAARWTGGPLGAFFGERPMRVAGSGSPEAYTTQPGSTASHAAGRCSARDAGKQWEESRLPVGVEDVYAIARG